MTENRCADFESQKATNAWLTEFPPYKAAINMRIKTQRALANTTHIFRSRPSPQLCYESPQPETLTKRSHSVGFSLQKYTFTTIKESPKIPDKQGG